MSFRLSEYRLIADQLDYPEGPVWMADGSVLVCEVGSGNIVRVDAATGAKTTIAKVDGGANGAALGPDGALYVCNNGGMIIQEIEGVRVTVASDPRRNGGSIDRVDLRTGAVAVLYTSFQASPAPGLPQRTYPLRSPDDIVFDSDGNFYITDWGRADPINRVRDMSGVYFAKPDGSLIKELVANLSAPNGIALSPRQDRLYVAETYTRRILYWELSGPGQIKPNSLNIDGSYLLTAHIPEQGTLDSMKVDVDGNVYVATMLPKGPNPWSDGGITVVSPEGKILDYIEIATGGVFDPLPSNLCFGGPDRKTAYITMGGSGRLLETRMSAAGLPPAFPR